MNPLREKMLARGVEPVLSERAAFIGTESRKWGKVVRDANFKIG